jgi:hypothetical protein
MSEAIEGNQITAMNPGDTHPAEKQNQQFYSLLDLVTLLDLPRKCAERLFQDEPGVIRDIPAGYKYPGLTVPKDVLLRVLKRAEVTGPRFLPTDWAKWLEGPRILHRIPDLGSHFRLGETRARRQFQREPGVLRFSVPGYRREVIRVPNEVVERVLRRSSVPEPAPDRRM